MYNTYNILYTIVLYFHKKDTLEFNIKSCVYLNRNNTIENNIFSRITYEIRGVSLVARTVYLK